MLLAPNAYVGLFIHCPPRKEKCKMPAQSIPILDNSVVSQQSVQRADQNDPIATWCLASGSPESRRARRQRGGLSQLRPPAGGEGVREKLEVLSLLTRLVDVEPGDRMYLLALPLSESGRSYCCLESTRCLVGCLVIFLTQKLNIFPYLANQLHCCVAVTAASLFLTFCFYSSQCAVASTSN